MEIIEEILPDVFLLSLNKSRDLRGDFIKIYNSLDLQNLGLNLFPKNLIFQTLH